MRALIDIVCVCVEPYMSPVQNIRDAVIKSEKYRRRERAFSWPQPEQLSKPYRVPPTQWLHTDGGARGFLSALSSRGFPSTETTARAHSIPPRRT